MNERIDEIVMERQKQGLSIQQLADMCQLSASTVSRTLAGKTEPTEYTLRMMETALGITDRLATEPTDEHEDYNKILKRYLDTQERRIARVRAHYNMLLEEKNRWIKRLVFLCLIFISFIFIMLIIDLTKSDIGWVRDTFG